MSLERLPPELLVQIMQEAGSLRDLYNLTKASLACFSGFSASRRCILSELFRRIFPHDNLRHALGIIHAPSDPRQVQPFLESYFNPNYSFNFPSNEADFLRLSYICDCLSYFCDKYLEDKLQDLLNLPMRSSSRRRQYGEPRNICNSHKDGAGDSLSLVEFTRIQRAFLHFELYCRVFPSKDKDERGNALWTAEKQFGLFTNELPDWEVEEMVCIEHHFCSIIDGTIDGFEEQLLKAVIAAPGVNLPASLWYDGQGRLPFELRASLCEFEDIHHAALDFFEQSKYSVGGLDHQQFLSPMTSQGLNFMYSFAISDDNARAATICSQLPFKRRDFLIDTFDYVEPKNLTHERLLEDDPSESNLGYRQYYIHLANTPYYSGKYFPLRHLGHVFWDAGRIANPTMSAAMSNLMFMDELRQLTQLVPRFTIPDIRGSLRGFLLPAEELNRIRRQFGLGSRP